ncbi:hypothetical protein MTO96_001152 [Rhipicephalus appendiculatus]
MPTDAAVKRARRRKFRARARLSRSSTSSGPSNLPPHPDRFVPIEMQPKSEEGFLRCDDSEHPTEGAVSNPFSNDEIVPTGEKVVSEMRACESSPHSTKTTDGNDFEDIPIKSTTGASSFDVEGNLITSEEAQSDTLTDAEAADISRLLRKALKKNGPCYQEVLLSALSPSQVQYVMHAYGTLTAFMNHRPEFAVAQEGRYIFVCYKDVDCEERDCSGSSHAQDEPRRGCYSRGSSDGGRQHAVTGEPERERCSSSSSSVYESAVEELSEEEEKHGLKDASCQALPSPCRSLEQLENVRQNQDSEVEQLRLKTEQLLARPQAATPKYVVRLRNRTSTREEKPVDKNRADDEVHPPQTRLPLRQMNLPPRLRPENKLLTHPVATKPRPLTQTEKYTRSETPLLAQAVHELPGCRKSANACRDGVQPSMVSSQEKTTARSSTDKQISQIVRMVKKQQPDHTEMEIREILRHLRLTKGGLSGMTFSAIVNLLLGQLKAGPADKE